MSEDNLLDDDTILAPNSQIPSPHSFSTQLVKNSVLRTSLVRKEMLSMQTLTQANMQVISSTLLSNYFLYLLIL